MTQSPHFWVFGKQGAVHSANSISRPRILDFAEVRQKNAILVSGRTRCARSSEDLLDKLNRLAGWKVSVVAMSGMNVELDTPMTG